MKSEHVSILVTKEVKISTLIDLQKYPKQSHLFDTYFKGKGQIIWHQLFLAIGLWCASLWCFMLSIIMPLSSQTSQWNLSPWCLVSQCLLSFTYIMDWYLQLANWWCVCKSKLWPQLANPNVRFVTKIINRWRVEQKYDAESCTGHFACKVCD